MSDPAAALATQLRNIESRTGRTLAQMRELVAASGLVKHGEIRSLLMERLGLGHGDANTVAHLVRQAAEPSATAEAADPLPAIYAGPKADLRPVHDAVLAAVRAFGPFEQAPKKGYVSLRRKKQFAMVGPATRTQVEVGLNVKDLAPHARLKAMAPGGMCAYAVRLASPAEVDATLVRWLRAAYDAAG